MDPETVTLLVLLLLVLIGTYLVVDLVIAAARVHRARLSEEQHDADPT